MPKKKKRRVTPGHIAALGREGLSRWLWAVIGELRDGLIVKHRITGEVRVIGK